MELLLSNSGQHRPDKQAHTNESEHSSGSLPELKPQHCITDTLLIYINTINMYKGLDLNKILFIWDLNNQHVFIFFFIHDIKSRHVKEDTTQHVPLYLCYIMHSVKYISRYIIPPTFGLTFKLP